MEIIKLLTTTIILFLVVSCSSKSTTNIDETTESNPFYFGADLSYVNEMEDCGVIYKDASEAEKDPYKIFEEAGANLVRLRLWHNPKWTNYSNFEDVKKSIQRAKNEKMKVLLDLHYSDNWADPEKQEAPEAWRTAINDTEVLGDSVYNYTYKILNNLANIDLLPELVQVGNEINSMILQQGELHSPINWERNSFLINKGIKAVREISIEKNKKIEVMLHIAQPENALWWFEQATQNGVLDFDWIGLSYYPLWSKYTLENVSKAFNTLISTYKKRLMVVETAYPFIMKNADNANNILGNEALIEGFPASEQGQLDYLNKLKDIIDTSGGEGLIYWEPAWVSNNCFTQWAQGSHWDNATLFDANNKAILGMQFYNASIKN